jgi:serine/threonine protein kinase
VKLMHKFLDALKYLAENKIVHRDLKPENLILATKGDDSDLRIADFGFATPVADGEKLFLRCGSPGYVAPELLGDCGYNESADVFSSGVIMYVMLTGRPVFRGDNVDEILEKNKNCEFDYPERYWSNISAQAKDLVGKLLIKEPELRITAAQALEHPWFHMEFGEDSRAILTDDFIFRDERDNNLGGSAAKNFLVTATPIMAGRKLTDTAPETPFLTSNFK